MKILLGWIDQMQNLRHDLTMQLRDIEVTVEFNATDPDPSVGMMGYGVDDYRITDDDGNALDWDLTDDEMYQLNCKVDEWMRDYEQEDFE